MRLSISILLLLFVAGCSSVPRPMTVVAPPTLACTPPGVRDLRLQEVHWEVVKVGDKSMFAVDSSGYVRLSENTADILRWVKGVKSQVRYYRRCVDSYNTAVTELEPSKI